MDPGERKTAEAIIRSVIEEEGFEAARLTVSSSRHVHLVLDRDPGQVTLKNCVFVNHRIRRELEHAGLNADDYSIDVESPGIDRALVTRRHFDRYRGERVKIEMKEPEAASGRVRFKGILKDLDGDDLTLTTEDEGDVVVSFEGIKSARLDPQLPF